MTLTLDLHLPRLPRRLAYLPHVERDAEFSADRTYRHWLTRRWGTGPELMFVSLNPSDANEHRDDATTRRDMQFAEDFGYDAALLMNLYAGVSRDPEQLARMADPIGPETDARLDRAAAEHDVIVFAWGANADPARARAVATRLWRVAAATGGTVAVLGWTEDGQPRHPLRLRRDTPLQCLTASAHDDMRDVDPRWARLLSDSTVIEGPNLETAS
ncbi:DUF1643 domain-containing protein [Mycobacterium avium subsp. hominissuis]|uniref:DUF1643 domain-containing protein n=1 Tax=Mycobacterium avium TaxID=1764 RepID=UPI0026668795|nr:DUF1643 domain-containing protein [Mycobacterium avium]MDO2396066.1 DUF1643 domain-containing protein [Mycobacterium avium subsp. hominissuis]